jgi:hypothetical protein
MLLRADINPWRLKDRLVVIGGGAARRFKGKDDFFYAIVADKRPSRYSVITLDESRHD